MTESAYKIKGDMHDWYKTVVFEVFRRIVLRTPVDTGRARGNWQIEVGRPASASLVITGDKGTVTEKAFNRADAKLAMISAFALVHITNNVEYVYYLEYNRRSKQYPEGMVEITLTEMANWLGNIK